MSKPKNNQRPGQQKNYSAPHKSLPFRILMIVLAAALAVGILILPIQSSIRSYAEEDSSAVTVSEFETGKLSEAISEAADGTDYNYITKICVMNGTLSANDWNALTAIPNLEYVELAKAETENGIVPENALMSRNRLKYISLPSNTEEIGDNAFSGNRTLEKISMPNTVRKVGKSAFEACESLAEMPNSISITEMGESAFRDCKSFTSFIVSPEITEIPANAFSKCGFSEIIIGPAVTSIGDGAFADCNSLKDVYVYAENAPSVNSSSAFMNVGAAVHVYNDENYSGWEYNNLKVTGDLDGEYPIEAPAEEETVTTAETEAIEETEVTEEAEAIEETEVTEAEETEAQTETAVQTASQSSGVNVVFVIVIAVMAAVIGVLATILVMKSKK